VVPASDQWQLHRSGVSDVSGNVEKVLEKPEATGSNAERFGFAPEADKKDARKHKLANGPAVRFEAGTEEADDGMARLVKEQVGVVDQENETRFRAEDERDKGSQAHPEANQSGGGNGFPFTLHGPLGSRKKAKEAHLDITTGTPDLSGSDCRNPTCCRINPAFPPVDSSTSVLVSRCAQAKQEF
jgi:hypothetical protein